MRPIYFLRRALDAMLRGPFVTLVAVGTIFVAVLVTGAFAAALSGADRLLATWGGEVQVSVYLKAGADLATAGAKAKELAPGFGVEAVTSAEALKRLRGSLGDMGPMLDGVTEQALPASIEVRAPGRSAAEVKALAAKLEAVPGADQVDYGGAWLGQLEELVRRARLAGLAVLLLLSAATAILVSNTLRLAVYARRDEIEIMKLVGATDGFVEAPFLIEGVLQGVAGAGLAAASLVGLWAALGPRLHAAFAFTAPLGRAELLPGKLLLALVAGGALVGFVGSLLSVNRFLRKV